MNSEVIIDVILLTKFFVPELNAQNAGMIIKETRMVVSVLYRSHFAIEVEASSWKGR